MLPFIDDNTSNCGEGRAYIQSAENRENTIANHYGWSTTGVIAP